MLKHCIFVMTLVVLFASEAVAAQNIDSVKKGILLVAFGTSAPGAERAIDNLVSETKAAFPGIEVRLAYTSNIIRRKLRRERNLEIPTPPEALAQMNDERFTHVYVQPMHVIPGEEYDDLKSAVNAFASVKGKYGFERIALGRPFLADSSDCELMAEILARRFAAKPEDSAIVLMGHGSSHEGNSMYVEMQKALSSKAKNIFLGTVEEGPGAERLAFDGVLAALKKTPYKTVALSPFMVVAGEHANNDLAGSGPDSWRSLFEKNGYRVETDLAGLGEYHEVAAIFVKRVEELTR